MGTVLQYKVQYQTKGESIHILNLNSIVPRIQQIYRFMWTAAQSCVVAFRLILQTVHFIRRNQDSDILRSRKTTGRLQAA